MDETSQGNLSIPKNPTIHPRHSSQQPKYTRCIDNVGFGCSNGSMHRPLLSTSHGFGSSHCEATRIASLLVLRPSILPLNRCAAGRSGDGVPRVLPLRALYHLCPPQHVPGGLTRRQCSFLSPGTATIQGRAPNRSQGVSYRQGSNSRPQGRHHQPRRPKLDRQGPPRRARQDLPPGGEAHHWERWGYHCGACRGVQKGTPNARPLQDIDRQHGGRRQPGLHQEAAANRSGVQSGGGEGRAGAEFGILAPSAHEDPGVHRREGGGEHQAGSVREGQVRCGGFLSRNQEVEASGTLQGQRYQVL